MLTLLLIAVAAICKALSDTITHHFDTSIFKNLSPKFWNPAVSSEEVGFIPFTKYRPDAWHLSNSIMIACLMLSGIFFDQYWFIQLNFYIRISVLIAGYILVFNVFYNKLFIKK